MKVDERIAYAVMQELARKAKETPSVKNASISNETQSQKETVETILKRFPTLVEFLKINKAYGKFVKYAKRRVRIDKDMLFRMKTNVIRKNKSIIVNCFSVYDTSEGACYWFELLDKFQNY